MGYMTNGLSFNTLRQANLKRLPTFKNKHGELAHDDPEGRDWTPAQWLQAVTGELGEYANIRKKFERGDLTEAEFQKCAAEELADTVARTWPDDAPAPARPYVVCTGGEPLLPLDKALVGQFSQGSVHSGPGAIELLCQLGLRRQKRSLWPDTAFNASFYFVSNELEADPLLYRHG